jgi:hypothetical protein
MASELFTDRNDLRERMAEQSPDAPSRLGLFAVERLVGADFIAVP